MECGDYAIDSGKDPAGDIWVETQSFAVTKVDDKHLEVTYHRHTSSSIAGIVGQISGSILTRRLGSGWPLRIS